MLKAKVSSYEARIISSDFRVYGMVHLAAHVSTTRMLNNTRRPFVPVTRCRVYRPGFQHPPAEEELLYEPHFLALPKRGVRWLVGGEADEASPGIELETRKLFALFEDYVLSGNLRLAPGARVSDYLIGGDGLRPFQNLFDAELRLPQRGITLVELPVAQRFPFVTVNFGAVGGLFDVVESREVPFLFEE